MASHRARSILYYMHSSHRFRQTITLCGALLLPLLNLQSKPEAEIQQANEIGSSDRWQFIAYGEVVGVQKFKGSLRIHGGTSLFRHMNQNQIRLFFLREARQLLILNQNSQEVGSFRTHRIEFESDQLPAHEQSLLLFGNFKIKPGANRPYLTVGYRAGLYRQVKGYIPPVYGDLHRQGRQIASSLRHNIDGKEMVYIPEDIAIYGQGKNPGLDNYNPLFYNRTPDKTMRIKPFYIDRYEVNNKEYLTFCKSAGHPLPHAWRKRGSFPEGRGAFPITLASFEDARSYARWSGKRLPTEIEWEMVARGGYRSLIKNGNNFMEARANPSIYPFGNKFDPDRCNTLESGIGDTVPVHKMKDSSPMGVVGLCGNAREWTASWYRVYKGHHLPNRRARLGKVFKVIRGGSYAQKKEYARSNFRDYGGFPTLARDRSAGFRMVMDLHQ